MNVLLMDASGVELTAALNTASSSVTLVELVVGTDIRDLFIDASYSDSDSQSARGSADLGAWTSRVVRFSTTGGALLVKYTSAEIEPLCMVRPDQSLTDRQIDTHSVTLTISDSETLNVPLTSLYDEKIDASWAVTCAAKNEPLPVLKLNRPISSIPSKSPTMRFIRSTSMSNESSHNGSARAPA